MDADRGTGARRTAERASTRPLLTLTALVLLTIPGTAGTVGRLVGAAAVMVAALVTWRAGRPVRGDRSQPWPWFGAGLAAVGVGSALGGVVALVAPGSGRVEELTDLGESLWRVLGIVLTYQGVVRWNRQRDGIATPQDWINGTAAVLGLTALLAVLLARGDRWPHPLETSEVAAAVVVVGTAATVSRLSGLRRDPRLWWVAGAIALVGGAEAAEILVDGLEQLPLASWTVAGLVVARAAHTRAPAGRSPRPASAQATAIGSGVVALLGAGVAALYHPTVQATGGAIVLRQDGPTWPVLAATTAFLAGVLKLGALARDRATLAASRREARTDELTGVGNRRALLEHLRRLADRDRRCALLMIDLDDFKAVNDRHGHLAGDDVLRGAAGALLRAVPPNALVVRTGGDEFAVVVDTDDVDTVALAAAVVAELEAVALPTTAGLRDSATGRHGLPGTSGTGHGLAASIGATAGPADPDRLLHRADIAMYEAKITGRAVVHYDDTLGAAVAERRLLGDELRTLLESDDPSALEVWYQPQLDARHGQLVGVEALVRWAHPRRGRLLPDAFLDLVEEQGLMFRLTEHVLRTAMRDARAWRDVGVRLRVSVNLAPEVLASESATELVMSTLAASGMDPRGIVLEVTESALIPGDSAAFAHAGELADHGLALSIDDYGTGYSSLAQLHHVPAAELKLDRALTRDLLTDRRAAVIAGATVELAHRLGMRVVAEGVEDTATLSLLAGLGCDEVQGWVHAAAMPADALLTWAVEHRPEPTPRSGRASAPPMAAARR
jgi:diguanylate cyclase (GGDEF)-like protein